MYSEDGLIQLNLQCSNIIGIKVNEMVVICWLLYGKWLSIPTKQGTTRSWNKGGGGGGVVNFLKINFLKRVQNNLLVICPWLNSIHWPGFKRENSFYRLKNGYLQKNCINTNFVYMWKNCLTEFFKSTNIKTKVQNTLGNPSSIMFHFSKDPK